MSNNTAADSSSSSFWFIQRRRCRWAARFRALQQLSSGGGSRARLTYIFSGYSVGKKRGWTCAIEGERESLLPTSSSARLIYLGRCVSSTCSYTLARYRARTTCCGRKKAFSQSVGLFGFFFTQLLTPAASTQLYSSLSGSALPFFRCSFSSSAHHR